MKRLSRMLREPLVHFLALGGLIFGLFGAVGEPRPEPAESIDVGPEHIERLATGFRSVWRRPPSDDELRAMIDDFVREEIYYREALALGLDRDDTVIRRRLRQKMEFLSDSGADLLEPTAGELEAYFAANEQTYRSAPALAFEQIYLGETPAPDGVRLTLAALQTEAGTASSALGEPTLLPARLGLSQQTAVDGVFGGGFFEQIAELSTGVWAGPVASGYGAHLVRVLDSQPARTPPLAEVREAVLRDWKAAKALEIRELHYARLRARFVVEIRGADGRTPETR